MLYAQIFRQKMTMIPETVVADTYGYLEIQYAFKTDDWSGLEKWAHFAAEGDGAVYDIRLTDDRIRRKDHLDLTAGTWKMYLHGNRIENGQVTERITTNVIALTVQPTGILEGEPFASLTPGLGEQIMARMDEMDGMYADLTAAVREANDAAEEAGISADAADIDAEDAKKAAETASATEKAVRSAVISAENAADRASAAASSASDAASSADDNARRSESEAQSAANSERLAELSAKSAETSADAAETSAKSANDALTAIRTLPTLTLTGTDESGAEHTWIVFGEVQA